MAGMPIDLPVDVASKERARPYAGIHLEHHRQSDQKLPTKLELHGDPKTIEAYKALWLEHQKPYLYPPISLSLVLGQACTVFYEHTKAESSVANQNCWGFQSQRDNAIRRADIWRQPTSHPLFFDLSLRPPSPENKPAAHGLLGSLRNRAPALSFVAGVFFEPTVGRIATVLSYTNFWDDGAFGLDSRGGQMAI